MTDFPNGGDYRKTEYRILLANHDWRFEFASDHSVWQKGKEERQRLVALQSEIDQDKVIWNQYSPD